MSDLPAPPTAHDNPSALPLAGRPGTGAAGRLAAVERLLAQMRGRRVVVVGDVCLDEYLVGEAERLSREGPVPVLAFRRRLDLPGGAANPARNLAALGAQVEQVAVVGADEPAGRLRAALDAAGIGTSGLIVDPGRPTTVKTRVVAEGLAAPQQVARIDRQVRDSIGGAVQAALLAALSMAAEGAEAILVSHYRSGVVTAAVASVARELGVACVTVDAQGDLDRFHGYRLLRVGRQDAVGSLGRHLATEAEFQQATADLRVRLGAAAVLLGRGAEGASLADEEGYAVFRPTNVSEVFDVSGAGDTVIAVATLALAAGAGMRDAVALANLAAGIVVRRLGVAAPTAAELLAEAARAVGAA